MGEARLLRSVAPERTNDRCSAISPPARDGIAIDRILQQTERTITCRCLDRTWNKATVASGELFTWVGGGGGIGQEAPTDAYCLFCCGKEAHLDPEQVKRGTTHVISGQARASCSPDGQDENLRRLLSVCLAIDKFNLDPDEQRTFACQSLTRNRQSTS